MSQRIKVLIAVLMLSAIAIGAAGTVVAQDATPAAGPIATIDLAPGVTAQVLASGPSVSAPGQTVYVATFDFQPGAEIFPHSHPGTTILGIQSGELGWTLQAGTATVVRAAGSGAPTGTETVDVPGTEVILEPGDAIYYERDVVHTARGAGDTDAIVIGSLVLDAGAPLLMPANMDMGTPSS